MKVVGVGCGPGMLTEEAIRAIQEAPAICGSRRAIALARAYIRRDCPVREVRDFSAPHQCPPDSVLLSTGDPLLAGLGHRGDSVIPGISSLQVACARLGIPLDRITIINAHARDARAAIGGVCEELARGTIVFLLADPRFPLDRLAAALPDDVKVIACEDLGYPGERIACGTPRSPPAIRSRLFVLVIGRFTVPDRVEQTSEQ